MVKENVVSFFCWTDMLISLHKFPSTHSYVLSVLRWEGHLKKKKIYMHLTFWLCFLHDIVATATFQPGTCKDISYYYNDHVVFS